MTQCHLGPEVPVLKLRDIMTSEVLTVSPQQSIQDAISLLVTRHVSGAPVVTGTQVIGVVSATDLLEFAASVTGVPEERTDQAEWGEWGIDRSAADQPKAENEPLALYFTELWDDAGAGVTERYEAITGPEWNTLREHTVGEAMTSDVRSLPPETGVPAAADFMRRAGIHRVLVMEHDRLVGIVTSTDIAKAVSEHRLSDRTYAFDRDRDFDARGWLPDGESKEV
jgi:CBS domain-containing protein